MANLCALQHGDGMQVIALQVQLVHIAPAVEAADEVHLLTVRGDLHLVHAPAAARVVGELHALVAVVALFEDELRIAAGARIAAVHREAEEHDVRVAEGEVRAGVHRAHDDGLAIRGDYRADGVGVGDDHQVAADLGFCAVQADDVQVVADGLLPGAVFVAAVDHMLAVGHPGVVELIPHAVGQLGDFAGGDFHHEEVGVAVRADVACAVKLVAEVLNDHGRVAGAAGIFRRGCIRRGADGAGLGRPKENPFPIRGPDGVNHRACKLAQRTGIRAVRDAQVHLATAEVEQRFSVRGEARGGGVFNGEGFTGGKILHRDGVGLAGGISQQIFCRAVIAAGEALQMDAVVKNGIALIHPSRPPSADISRTSPPAPAGGGSGCAACRCGSGRGFHRGTSPIGRVPPGDARARR